MKKAEYWARGLTQEVKEDKGGANDRGQGDGWGFGRANGRRSGQSCVGRQRRVIGRGDDGASASRSRGRGGQQRMRMRGVRDQAKDAGEKK